MRVAIDVRELLPGRLTGTGRFLNNFLEHIPSRSLSSFSLFADGHTGDIPAGVASRVIRAHAPCVLWFDQVTIPRLIKQHGIEVFFSPYYKIPFAAAVKKIITLHDVQFLYPLLRRGWGRLRPYVTYMRRAIASAQTIVTVSEFSKREIVRMFAVDAGKIAVVYNAVSSRFRVMPSSSGESPAQKYGIHSPYLLFVGNASPHKNIEGLLEAFARIPQRRTHKLVIIARHDIHYPALARRSESLGIADHVLFLDFVPDEELVRWYNGAQCFVFPSWYEGFGLPPLEAMSCGAPVVASRAASLPEVLGECAVYVDPARPDDIAAGIVRVLADPALRAALRQQGPAHAARYTPQLFSERLCAVLQGACGI